MFQFQPDTRYRMPVVFGPMPGPRQQHSGEPYPDTMARIEIVTTSFLTERAHLERLLPAGFALEGEPVVTIEFYHMTELLWLAGRGYNTLGMRFPVRYTSRAEQVRGTFLTVLWESRADPIVTGREELGFAKIYGEIPPPQILGDRRLYSASWDGHRFMDMEVGGLIEAPFVPEEGDGIIQYRYLPSARAIGQADSATVVLTPTGSRFELLAHLKGRGNAKFHESTWEQLPTFFHIVNTLAAMPMLETRGATLIDCRLDNVLHHHREIG